MAQMLRMKDHRKTLKRLALAGSLQIEDLKLQPIYPR